MSWLYRVSGLTLSVDRPLPYVHAAEGAGDPDVHIAFAPFDAREASLRVGPFHIHDRSLVDFALPGMPVIRIADGSRITVAPFPECDAGALHTLLFGPAFAILLHQRGQPPLHAGAVRVGDGAIAVAGHSGAGKSTTVRALLARGCPLLCDDQLVVAPDSGLAHAGFPSMKLWRSSAVVFNDTFETSRRVQPGLDKYHLPMPDAFTADAAPLKAVFILARDPDAAEPVIEQLRGPHAVAGLGGLSHFGEVAAAMGVRAIIFRWAAEIAARVPVYRVRWPDDLSRLDELVDNLLSRSGSRDGTAVGHEGATR